jgi:predicted dehydrogenase
VLDADRERAERIGEAYGCEWSPDPYGYLGVTGTGSSTVEGGMVVIATPPAQRVELVRAVLDGYGHKPTAIRIEKPLALTSADADTIAEMCAAADVELSVGFTLLHHPLYEAAFAYLDATSCTAQWVEAIRIGAPARHDAHAMLDAGIHAAAVAAYLDVPSGIMASYCEHAQMRRTTIHTDRGSVSIDEIAGTVETPIGPITIMDGDALELELGAWMAGTHRGTPAVALAAQDMIDDAISERMVAA